MYAVLMGKGRPRAVEKGVVGPNLSVSASGSLNIPSAPVYYPTEDEFRDPLEYIYKIRPEAELYGICRIVPPKNWKPPFALDLDSFTFPTKTQAIHQLQVRPASCDSKTFELEYNRFLEDHCGKKLRKKVVFEGEELDLCKLFNAVKRYGGYDKVVKGKKWGEVARFVRPARKISECSKHVLCQLYRDHLHDYEKYYNKLNKEVVRSRKRGMHEEKRSEQNVECSSSKRRRTNNEGEKVKVCKVEKEDEEHDQICEQCRSGLHGEVMLLCDRCNKGWHIHCLSPPLKQVPPGNWYCLDCLNSDKDSFGFVPGKRFSLEVFRRVANRSKRKWFGSGSASRVQIEKKFWEIVEGSIGEVEVMYGSDLDTSIYGSGFPRGNDQRPESVEAKIWDEYCGSPWNLNNLPKLKGSVLRTVHHNIAGVMVPWLGEPKCWYSVPGSEASAFEKVMRNSLPDLFDAQPDLLFQLVTMLNPSVLQENGVPVYSVLQEPGNFVITFPRSYHGGFNLGLNCAEAVNFAPADWLPHGGFGAGLYQLYRKTAVLSHEELVCVVAKSDCDSRVTPYLKKELTRVYSKEKTWRERLWRKGIIKSSLMSSRKCPEYVGTEEDPTCIICKQYLYLSAVVCRCRPSAFVCLEHWEHLCECKSRRLRLLYRHTLGELHDLVLAMDKHCFEETTESRTLRRQISCPDEPTALEKKGPFSRDEYVSVLKEAEQFLWAGSEMNPVREMEKNLIRSQKWAEGVRDCLSKIETWSSHCGNGIERAHLEYINELLSFDAVPCYEPGHLNLKNYAEQARGLIQDIESAMSSCPKISELELLYSRACEFPIYVKESENLLQRISSAKVLMEGIRNCISEKRPAAIDVDSSELQVQLPDVEKLSDLLEKAESCRVQCGEILKDHISLKDVEVLLQELDGFTVNIPELKLLSQYHTDAVSWISRFDAVLVSSHGREDQNNAVDELMLILKDGASLRIKVDQLSLVECELKKARCREKALRMRDTKLSLDFIQEVIMEAAVLHIEGEKLFVDMSKVLDAALQWEERAKYILAHEAHISDFEDVIRSSEDIYVNLPSLLDVKDTLSKAMAWLRSSEPFLVTCSPLVPASSSLLNVDTLKELVSESKCINVSLKEKTMLETVLMNCEEWKHDAFSLLQDISCLFDMRISGDGIRDSLISKIESLVKRIESMENTGLSLAFDFDELAKLKDDVDGLMNGVENSCGTYASSALWCSLVDGVKWLKHATKSLSVYFPLMFGQVESAIQKHKCWLEQVHQLFSLRPGERSWSLMLQLKELGVSVAFSCTELDLIISEVGRVESWKRQCMDIVKSLIEDEDSLLGALEKMSQTLDRSLHIYDKPHGLKESENEVLKEVMKKALACKSRLKEIVDFALAYSDKDLSVIFGKLSTALKAREMEGVHDHEGDCNLMLVLSRYSWKVKVNKSLEGSQKPTIQQIQQHLKEGAALNIPPGDYYRQKLTEVKCIGLQWADNAKKVAADSGALPLGKVFELVLEGENLPVLLKIRSMLYCICRKPYDQRAMIACDQCDEWYHFDCLKLHSAPEVYICPACEPRAQETEVFSTASGVDHERW
ncbi:transcription factor jumonji domain-containing protein [Prunus dulcis]|uniref:Transcription factor jumonji domain-containing protein n=1 Tax=Prunus dulcis TaxID=3755 RepID=A0A4Y1RGH2_PRUDU|nr:transcription factor jumonji domain-containing protein [Prunus dulcis]